MFIMVVLTTQVMPAQRPSRLHIEFTGGYFSETELFQDNCWFLCVKQENCKKKLPRNSILRDLKTTLFHFLLSGIPYHTTIYELTIYEFQCPNFSENQIWRPPLWLKVVEWWTIEWAWRQRAFSLDKAKDGAHTICRPTFRAQPPSQSNYDADADAKEMQWRRRRRLKFKFKSGNLWFHFIDVAASWNKSIGIWFCEKNYTLIDTHGHCEWDCA